MALLNDRYEAITDISFFMDQVSERGGIACVATAGSGAAMDQSEAEVAYKANPSGFLPMGLLLTEVVNKDLTRTHLNFHQNETQKGNKVTLLLEGWAVTDMVSAGMTPTVGQKAYVGLSGTIANIATADDGEIGSNNSIGRFMSTKDENGFVKVYVKMPAQ